MQRFILMMIIAGLCCFQTVLGQTGTVSHIFPASHKAAKDIYPKATGRFTPTPAEAKRAADIVREKLQQMNNKTLKSLRNNWDFYGKQYVGFIGENGKKIIWINFFWPEDELKANLTKQIIQVEDGGTYYWNVKVNLSNGRVFELRINSRA